MPPAPLIVAGFSDDVASTLRELQADLKPFVLDENTPDDCVLPQTPLAIYLFSLDTGYSSQMLSRFHWIHHHIRPREEYVLAIGDVDLKRIVFPFMKNFAVTTVEELNVRLKRDDV